MPVQLNLNSVIVVNNSAGAGGAPPALPPVEDTLITEGGITITLEDGTVIVLES